MKAPVQLKFDGDTTATDATVRFHTRLVDRSRPSWRFSVRVYEDGDAVFVFPDVGQAPGRLWVTRRARSRDERRANYIHAIAAWMDHHRATLGTHQETGQWTAKALPYIGNGKRYEVWIPLDVRDKTGKAGTESYLRGRR